MMNQKKWQLNLPISIPIPTNSHLLLLLLAAQSIHAYPQMEETHGLTKVYLGQTTIVRTYRLGGGTSTSNGPIVMRPQTTDAPVSSTTTMPSATPITSPTFDTTSTSILPPTSSPSNTTTSVPTTSLSLIDLSAIPQLPSSSEGILPTPPSNSSFSNSDSNSIDATTSAVTTNPTIISPAAIAGIVIAVLLALLTIFLLTYAAVLRRRQRRQLQLQREQIMAWHGRKRDPNGTSTSGTGTGPDDKHSDPDTDIDPDTDALTQPPPRPSSRGNLLSRALGSRTATMSSSSPSAPTAKAHLSTSERWKQWLGQASSRTSRRLSQRRLFELPGDMGMSRMELPGDEPETEMHDYGYGYGQTQAQAQAQAHGHDCGYGEVKQGIVVGVGVEDAEWARRQGSWDVARPETVGTSGQSVYSNDSKSLWSPDKKESRPSELPA